MELTDFSWALKWLKKGAKVQLSRWPDGSYVSIRMPDKNSKMTIPYFYMHVGTITVPWIPSYMELMADDWSIVDDINDEDG